MKLAGGGALWRDARPVHGKHGWHHPLPHSLYKYYMNHGWTAAICKIYCPSLLRGILWMPNIFHLNRWKLQRRDGVSIGGEMKRKGKEEKDDGGRWRCVCVCVGMCVYKTSSNICTLMSTLWWTQSPVPDPQLMECRLLAGESHNQRVAFALLIFLLSFSHLFYLALYFLLGILHVSYSQENTMSTTKLNITVSYTLCK